MSSKTRTLGFRYRQAFKRGRIRLRGSYTRDDLQPGQEVTVSFDIRGREHNGRYYNNLQGWRVHRVESGAGEAPPVYSDEPPPMGDEDIPF